MAFTMSTLDYLEREGIEGDLVECGVLRGGHMLLAKAYARSQAISARKYWLFDTFNGMPEAGEHDYRPSGKHARGKGTGWCRATLDTVRGNFSSRDLLDEDVIFVQGMVEETLFQANVPDKIAMLRLDTDFYSSTKVELEVLYPRLVDGGVLVIDDYGFWEGAKKAVHEYFGSDVDLSVVDSSARMLIKNRKGALCR
jgi:hypothetical protein